MVVENILPGDCVSKYKLLLTVISWKFFTTVNYEPRCEKTGPHKPGCAVTEMPRGLKFRI